MVVNKAAWAALLFSAAAQAQPVVLSAARDLADLSLEQLSNIVVSSVSGRPDPCPGRRAPFMSSPATTFGGPA
jgi:hypothetical protein